MSFGSTNRQAAPEKKLANVDANQLNSNQQTIPVTWMAGRRRIPLHWFTPAYNQVNEPVKTKTGKSEKKTTGYIYYVDVAGLICLGGRKPVDRIHRHIIEKELRWENAAGLARGTSESAAIAITDFAATTIYWGTPTQPLDPTVLTPRTDTPTNPLFDPRDPTTWPGGGNQSADHPGYTPP